MLSVDASASPTRQMIKTFQEVSMIEEPGEHHAIGTERVLVAIQRFMIKHSRQPGYLKLNLEWEGI